MSILWYKEKFSIYSKILELFQTKLQIYNYNCNLIIHLSIKYNIKKYINSDMTQEN